MKKIFGFVLITFLALSVLPAQAVENDDDSFASPSISVGNELTIKGVKSSEDETKGNFTPHPEEFLENATTATLAVGLNLFEGFQLKPYIKDKVVFEGAGIFFKNNKLTIGIEGSYEPMEILGISFGLGYVSKIGKFADEVEIGSLTTRFGTFAGNGLTANLGLALNVPSIFLEAGVGYEFDGMFAKPTVSKVGYASSNSLEHVIGLEAKFDFFNFIKEDLDSGLVLSNETTISSEWLGAGGDIGGLSAYTVLSGEKKIENEFGIGLHFGMLKYADISFMTKIANESTKKWKMPEKKYGDAEKGMSIALSLGLEFEKDMFSFGLEYSPQLMVKEGDKTKQEHEHELKVALGIAL